MYINVNRLNDARQTIQEAQQKNFDDLNIRSDLYSLAFLSGDSAEMERDVAWGAGRPNDEDQMLNTHADTHAYYGRLGKARDLARRASDSAVRSDAKETPPNGLPFRRSARLNSAMWLLPGKVSPERWRSLPGVMSKSSPPWRWHVAAKLLNPEPSSRDSKSQNPPTLILRCTGSR
jgi:hypothetical protein